MNDWGQQQLKRVLCVISDATEAPTSDSYTIWQAIGIVIATSNFLLAISQWRIRDFEKRRTDYGVWDGALETE